MYWTLCCRKNMSNEAHSFCYCVQLWHLYDPIPPIEQLCFSFTLWKFNCRIKKQLKMKIIFSNLPPLLPLLLSQTPGVPQEAAEQLLHLTHSLRKTNDPTVSTYVCVCVSSLFTCVPSKQFIYLCMCVCVCPAGPVSGLLSLHQTAAEDLSPSLSVPRGEHRPRCQQGLSI